MSAICWFRKGLRLHDNPALSHAVAVAEQHGGVVYPLFILDPTFWKGGTVGKLRAQFLIDALSDLDASLRRVGSMLYIARGKPDEVLPKLYKQWDIHTLTFEADTEPYAKSRDAAAKKAAESAKVEVAMFHSHTLHDLDMYLKRNKGEAPTTYGAFNKIFAKLPSVPQPEPPVTSIPSAPDSADDDAMFRPSSGTKHNGKEDDTASHVPTLSELGYDPIEPPQKVLYPGGETEGLLRMDSHLERKAWIRNFEKPKTSPNSLEPDTTVLSPYLKFGCISSRRFYHGLKAVYKGGHHSSPPVSLEGQMLWREFYYLVGHATPHYDRMEGNPICRQIPWDNDPKVLTAWEEGRTGYPWIDAIMTQLRNEGWIHHLARHAVACFLTRGDLWQSWEKGAAVFDRLLLDADWSLNNGNWMWLSCSSFFYQYFRCYSPVSFGKKTDPEGAYIKKHLPILRKFPKKYIYEPWTAPLDVQKKAGCIIGKDYPKPTVDHKEVSKVNMDKMHKAYDKHKEKHNNGSGGGGSGSGTKHNADGGQKSPSKKARTS
eukprot:m.32916 g.32916  ORF g.32916 m.32916 type:complete len:542 (+) comp4946_c0_seq1:304-1929(+)